MKHTPGPWLIHPVGEAVYSERHGFVCLTTKPGVSMTEQKMANATLIAAAPEMLELLQSIHEDLLDGRSGPVFLEEIRSKSGNLIEKATTIPAKPIVKGCDNCGYAHINHKRCDAPKPCTNGSEWIERKQP